MNKVFLSIWGLVFPLTSVHLLDGLVQPAELSWAKHQTKPNDVLKLDQELEAVVLSINRAEKRISISVRQIKTNPWAKASEKYPPGAKVRGRPVLKSAASS